MCVQTAVHYYSLLNSLQYKRRCSLLEPVIGFIQAQKTFFEMGIEMLSRKDVDDFVANIVASVQRYASGYCQSFTIIVMIIIIIMYVCFLLVILIFLFC